MCLGKKEHALLWSVLFFVALFFGLVFKHLLFDSKAFCCFFGSGCFVVPDAGDSFCHSAKHYIHSPRILQMGDTIENMNTTAQKLEAILFYLNEEVKKKRLAEILGVTLGELEEAIEELRQARTESGIVVIETPTSVTLGTHPSTSELIESVREGEKESPLSKAAMETLAIIAYQAPLTRAQVDTIRGVNSMYSIRNLLVRGLISRRNREGQVIYEPTAEVLELLGITAQVELPDYEEVGTKISQIMGGHSEAQPSENNEEVADQEAAQAREESSTRGEH